MKISVKRLPNGGGCGKIIKHKRVEARLNKTVFGKSSKNRVKRANGGESSPRVSVKVRPEVKGEVTLYGEPSVIGNEGFIAEVKWNSGSTNRLYCIIYYAVEVFL